MRHVTHLAAIVLGVLGVQGYLLAEAKVQEQAVGPSGQDVKYVVSPQGGHLACVTHKGSRMTVIIDGVAGPKVEEVITPVAAWVDPRPWAGKSGNDVPQPAPVIFSKDGSRWAYVARVGQEWIVMVDGKEAMRIPASGAVGAVAGVAGNAGNTDVRLEFTGESGTHLLMAKSTFNGYELWVDGQKWPGVYGSGGGGSAGTIDPLVSPDGQHIAYVAQIDRDKSALLLDGKDVGYRADNLQFTADSKHLVGLNQEKEDQALLIDGKPLIKAKGIYAIYLPPAGNRIIAVLRHQDPNGGAIGQFLWVDGKPVESSLCETIKRVLYSPDGQHYAAICGRTGAAFVVRDGKKGQEYQIINDAGIFPGTSMIWSEDSSKLGYIANVGMRSFVVINDEESDAFDTQGYFKFSPDGKHVVMTGMQGQKSVLIIDDKAVSLPARASVSLESFIFSPDNSRHAYLIGGNPKEGGPVVVDEKPTGISGLFNFSPDSKHLCITGSHATDNKKGLFLDGQLVFPAENAILYRAFTPDSQHLYWMTREPAKGPDAAPGSWQFVTYLDGKPIARADQNNETQSILLPAGFGSFTKTIPAWSVGADGTLTCLAPSGDAIKRTQATPSNDTSLATLMTSHEAVPAGAKEAPEAHPQPAPRRR